MINPAALANILARLSRLEAELTGLYDRVAVLEENTCTWDNRLEQLEEWQEQTDDKLDKEL
jgi:glycyl-tRNA synthetase beta subunit